MLDWNKNGQIFNKMITLQVCEGMVYLEKENFIHSDLRADNILIDAKDNVLIADFGLGKMLDRDNNIYVGGIGEL